MQEPTLRSTFVSAKGGQLDFVSQDGEVLMSVAVPPGIVPAREYLELAPEGARVEVSKGLVVREPRSGFGVQPHPERLDAGANPDYVPTSADRLQRQMRHQMAQMQAEMRGLAARQNALARVETVPQAPKPETEGEPEVVE